MDGLEARRPAAGSTRRWAARLALMGAAGILLAGCASTVREPEVPAAPPPIPALPPPFAPEELVGRWGYTSYHREEDRARTERAAASQCSKPYVIGRGTAGGIMMHPADQPQQVEMLVKGSPNGKTYIGPAPSPEDMGDREVVSFDGRVLILRWMDPEVQGRYGNSVYVRCGPRAA